VAYNMETRGENRSKDGTMAAFTASSTLFTAQRLRMSIKAR